MNDKLFIERILDFCDVPQLFIARDAFDTTYLCLLYEDEPSCLYTAIRISNDRLQSFLAGKADLRDLFDNPETPFEYFDVEYDNDNYYFKPYVSARVGEERQAGWIFTAPNQMETSMVTTNRIRVTMRKIRNFWITQDP